ncbi:PepSY-associated TM helix domain-containing protein [Methylocapsa palsarum]|uniref:Uncharacterized iron-regulated membrane protein n=1 Tax=Methylocapsa palsarum TaxID=1612308 RepID=A0A1I4AQN7_9HYPH|nr:PepSY domain-containing protein [Methylocapsa palsarum]SFK58211.1 Uncharacterized iron-regulated membrane protein [Methylocapsa palsarum]
MNMLTRPLDGPRPADNPGAAYRMIWRWHFYAGLFCLPFVAILCVTGAIYLFQPHIDAWFDRGFDHLALSEAPRPLDEQVAAAQASNPAARLAALEFREDRTDAARVDLMTAEGHGLRVMVRPDTLDILDTTDWKNRFTQVVRDIHGSLLLGQSGAIAVELAGAWAIVMVLTGLYLWWPRGSGLAGVLYPRLGGRRFLRDLHAVTGLYLSLFALFFLISALPWTPIWGKTFEHIRSIGKAAQAEQDWTAGPESEEAKRLDAYNRAPPAPAEAGSGGPHAGHLGYGSQSAQEGAPAASVKGFDRLYPIAAALHLAPPVLITPPSSESPNWAVQSTSLNFTARESFEFDPKTLRMVKKDGFSEHGLLDKTIDVGIAAHQGQLFGWFNQLLGLLTAAGYLMLVVTSTLMWWRRRPTGSLGAPPALTRAPKLAPFLLGLIVLLGLLLPTLGLSLVAILAGELAIRRFAPGASRWLGLVPLRNRSAD